MKLRVAARLLLDNTPVHTAQALVDETYFECLSYPRTHKLESILASSCSLNSNPACLVEILETKKGSDVV